MDEVFSRPSADLGNIVRVLIDIGAEVKIANKKGETAFEIACRTHKDTEIPDMIFEKLDHIGPDPSANVTTYMKQKLKKAVNSKEESTKTRIKELLNKGASLEVAMSIRIEDPEIEETIVLTKFNELVRENQYTELERLMDNSPKINLLKTDINGEQCIETIIEEASPYKTSPRSISKKRQIKEVGRSMFRGPRGDNKEKDVWRYRHRPKHKDR